jgi:hypothetical protein
MDPRSAVLTEATGADVERVVIELNRICKAATFDFSMRVGLLIIDNFYAGDLGAWRHRGEKSVSFRKLAKHPNLPMSPSSLYRCVAIYEVCVCLGVDGWKHVSPTHVRTVLALPRHQQSELLHTAEAEAWTVRRLREAIVRLRSAPDGQSAADTESRTRLRKMIRGLDACLGQTAQLVGSTGADIPLSPDMVQSFADIAHRMREACATLEKRLLANANANEDMTCENGQHRVTA